MSKIDILITSFEIVFRSMQKKTPHWWLVNIGSGNDLVPSGTKPIPEPTLLEIYIAI